METSKGLRIRPDNVDHFVEVQKKEHKTSKRQIPEEELNNSVDDINFPPSNTKSTDKMEGSKQESNRNNNKSCEIGDMVSQLEKKASEIVISTKHPSSAEELKHQGKSTHKKISSKEMSNASKPDSRRDENAQGEDSSFNLSDSVICIDDSTDFAKAISSKGAKPKIKTSAKQKESPKSKGSELDSSKSKGSELDGSKSKQSSHIDKSEHGTKDKTCVKVNERSDNAMPSFSSLSKSVKDKITPKDGHQNDSFRQFRDPEASSSSKTKKEVRDKQSYRDSSEKSKSHASLPKEASSSSTSKTSQPKDVCTSAKTSQSSDSSLKSGLSSSSTKVEPVIDLTDDKADQGRPVHTHPAPSVHTHPARQGKGLSHSQLVKQRDSVQQEMTEIQSRLRGINLNMLPDKGQKVINSLKIKEDCIKEFNKQIALTRGVDPRDGGQGLAPSGVQTIRVQSGSGGSQVIRMHNSQSYIKMPQSQGQTSQSSQGHPQVTTVRPPGGGGQQGSISGSHMVMSSSQSQAQSLLQNLHRQAQGHHASQGHASTSQPQASGMRQTVLLPQQALPDISHLPEHIQQYFAANPQARTLYGGRMTTQRLKEVGSITAEAIDGLHKQIETRPSDSTEVPDPPGLTVTLMPHQRHALAWMQWREAQKPPGGILADDMGLGKTLTTISHVLRMKLQREESKEEWNSRDKQAEKLSKAMKKCAATLIIAPASLVHQWGKEIERRCRRGSLRFHLYHGPNRETSVHKLIKNDIVITSYSIVAREVGVDKAQDADMPVTDATDDTDEDKAASQRNPEETPLLLRIGWERIIIDEGHNIKNHKSSTSTAVCRLRAASRFVLTGTPIQNNLLDMFSLLRFLRFSPFDEYKVWKKQIDSSKGNVKRLNTIVKALLLRRTKEDTTALGKPIVDLPSRELHVIDVSLSEEERGVYDRLFKMSQRKVQEYVNRHEEKESGIPSRGADHQPYGSRLDTDRGSHPHDQASGQPPTQPPGGRNTGSDILVMLLRLRQCCSHLSLMKEQLEPEALETDGIELSLEQQMKGMGLEEGTGGEREAEEKRKWDKDNVSTKLKVVLDKVGEISEASGNQDKCVIVSQWTQMLDIMAAHLRKVKVTYSLIQGNIPAKKRMDIVDDFNTNPKGSRVVLVSLRAGGVGLNLTGGNHLFLLDNHWNPALEEQACDRIYRMGQKKDVHIYRYLCKDTIEERIAELQKGKLNLAKSVLSGASVKSQKLTLNDLRSLFGV